MHLSQRHASWRFQIRVPRELEKVFGSAPLRVTLGPQSKRSATRAARLLAGHAEKVFFACRLGAKMTKDQLIQELQEMLVGALDAAEQIQKAADRRREAELKTLRVSLMTERLMQQKAVGTGLARVGDRLEGLRAGISRLPKNQRDPLTAQIAELHGLVRQVLDGGPERPYLLDELDRWIELRTGHAAEKKIRTDKNRILDFVEFAGNKPVNKYRHSEFQAFANLLARVPANYSKHPKLREMTRAEAVAFNDSLPPSRRFPTLAGTAIESNYFSPLNMFFKAMAAEHDFRSPLAEYGITVPVNAKESVERSPFTVEELNVWFAAAAKETRPDIKWLPLLATLTGARVGELIHLQGKDVYQVGDGLWVASLITDIVVPDGSTQKRQIKNKVSRRLFALHSILEKTDFFRYCRTRAEDEWLFPHAFWHGKKRVEDPADAASKRMNRKLKEVGIHRPLEATFHSTRHSAKDLMRVAKIDPRTADRQTGHAPKSVADRYGSKLLLTEEVEVLAALPLPDGLDLTPYFINE